MASPRLRLLLLAHARGLVKPDYPFGVKSRIRENLLLRAVCRELDGDLLAVRGQMEAHLVPLVEPNARPEVFQDSVNFLLQARSMRLGQQPDTPPGAHKSAGSKTITDMIALLNILEETDFSDRMEAVLKSL